MTPANSFSASDKRTRIALIALVCSLHAALIFGWRGTAPLPNRESVTYMDIWHREALLQKPATTLDRPSQAPGTPRNAATRTRRAEPAAHPAPSPGALTRSDAEQPDPAPAPIPDARLDLDSLRSQARQGEKNRIKSPLERQREDERAARTVETQIAEAAKRGARKNCQTDYAGYGLFAAIPLVYGSLTDNGCKWK